MIEGINLPGSLDPQMRAAFQTLSRYSWGILTNSVSDSSTITADTLPANYAQYYVNGTDTRIFFNVNNSILSIGTNALDLTGKTQYSVVLNNGILQLDGDQQSPGNNKFYGTDGSGNKSWITISGYSLYSDVRFRNALFVTGTYTGTVSYTGVGFQPKLIKFTWWMPSNTGTGWDDGVNKYWTSTVVPLSFQYGIYDSIYVYTPTGNSHGYVSSFDADGFSIYWAYSGGGAIASCACTAFR